MAENETQKTPLIYSKIAEVMTNLNAIGKGRKTSGFGASFNFRGIDDVMNELHPILAKAGVFVVPNVLNEVREERKNSKGTLLFYTRLTIRFSFYAADGSHIDSTVIGEAMDSGDKASNKAMSIGYKYACLQVFCIPTEDDKDPDAQVHQVAPKEAYNAPSNATQRPYNNNRVNYQQQPNNAPQYNRAPQGNAPQQGLFNNNGESIF